MEVLGMLNPWSLSPLVWVAGFLLARGAIALYDHLVVGLISLTKQPKLPTRTTGVPVRYVSLRAVDITYLAINAVNEWIFVQNLCHYLWFSEFVPKEVANLGILNTVGALYLMFVVLDLFYAPAHRFMHWRAVYPYIHKHHHRQVFPVRGYLDAGNEHPVEHFIGTSCTWAAVLAAVHITGAHAITIFVFFNVHAALAMLNHSPFDVEFSFFGLNYSVKAHEMHHRKFTTNYAQYWMGIDRLMGTFSPYEASITQSAGKLD